MKKKQIYLYSAADWWGELILKPLINLLMEFMSNRPIIGDFTK